MPSMPLHIRAAPITSATASDICETARKFLSLCPPPEPTTDREPDLSCSTRLMRSAASAGANPEITPAIKASRSERPSARPFSEMFDQPAMKRATRSGIVYSQMRIYIRANSSPPTPPISPRRMFSVSN